MRTISVLIEIEDNDLVEYALNKELYELLGSSIKDYKVLPDTKEIYKTDASFKKMVDAKRKAQKEIDKYINKQKLK